MRTERLYYEDSHLRAFDAHVTDCREAGGHYEVELDRTAFFPEGGGQAGDRGVIDEVEVTDTRTRCGSVLHFTGEPLAPGSAVHGEISWQTRFPRMQNHSAEHIVSGLVFSRFGFHNVGFHMGGDGVVVDFDGFMTDEELSEVEEEANGVVTDDRAVTAFFPSREELGRLSYRSKLDLTEDVRLVSIEGCDLCACCAPHVKRTGEIGVIKILESVRHKGGVRLRMIAGHDAFEDYRRKTDALSRASALLSAPPEMVAEAVRRVLRERDELDYTMGGLKRELVSLKASALERTAGNMLFFEPRFGREEAKLLCEAALPLCGGICGVFFGSGQLRYMLMSGSVDLREVARSMSSALGGRGGGSAGAVSGITDASEEEIRAFFGGERK